MKRLQRYIYLKWNQRWKTFELFSIAQFRVCVHGRLWGLELTNFEFDSIQNSPDKKPKTSKNIFQRIFNETYFVPRLILTHFQLLLQQQLIKFYDRKEKISKLRRFCNPLNFYCFFDAEFGFIPCSWCIVFQRCKIFLTLYS